MQTRASLLLRIRDPKDNLAWSEFVRLYAPLLHSYAMRRGLQDADAADLAQDTLGNVLRAVPEFRYDPAKGSFRGWLLTIARNQIRKFAQRRAKLATGSGDSDVRDMLEAHPEPAEDEQTWEREYQLHLFHWASKRVQAEFRDATWQAFWRTVVLNQAVNLVAGELAMTAGAVYIARSRVTARILKEIASVEGDES